eukprot:gene23259-9567_t
MISDDKLLSFENIFGTTSSRELWELNVKGDADKRSVFVSQLLMSPSKTFSSSDTASSPPTSTPSIVPPTSTPSIVPPTSTLSITPPRTSTASTSYTLSAAGTASVSISITRTEPATLTMTNKTNGTIQLV